MDTTPPPLSPNLLKQPPEILSSINELRDVSTALSAFLHDFHDLHNHITSITSAIDAQLPPHLLLLNTTTNATATEPIFTERNPNGTEKRSGQLTRASTDDDLRKVVEETSDRLQGIDVFNMIKEEESDIDIMIEDIDCQYNAIIEVDIIEKSESFRKAGEIDESKEDEGTDVYKEKDNKKRKLEETHVSKEDGEIEIFKEKDGEINVSKKKHDETEAFKTSAEIDVSKNPEISDILWKPEAEIDISIKTKERETSKKDAEDDAFKRPAQYDALQKPQEETEALKELVENDIFNKPKEIDVLKEPQEETKASSKLIEIEISNKPEEIDGSKKPLEETDASKKPVQNDVGIIKKRNVLLKRKHDQMKRHEEIDKSKKKHEEIDNLKKEDEKIDISKKKHGETNALKRPAEIDVSKKPEISDILWKPEAEIHTLAKPKERSKEDGETFKRPAQNDILNNPEEMDVPKEPQEETDASKKPVEAGILNKPEEIGVSKKPLGETDASKKEMDVLNQPEKVDVSNKPDEINASKKSAIAVLECLCKEMRPKKMKKHVVAHISELNSLHREIAKALKLAMSPVKLVLQGIHRFFLQNSKSYSGESGHQQIAIRQASVLILECFVMISSDGIKVKKEDKKYAESAAIDWRKRMINEGGLKCVEAIDARGLLLFMSGFGIPDGVFSNEDFSDLIKASNVKEISNALRHSTILISKLPEVIDWMVKNNLEIEAADIAYTFGLEDKCHPETILMTFLHNKTKNTQTGSSLQVIAATMQQLSDLTSIRRCLENHKIDTSNFFLDVKINEKIDELEKFVNELDKKLTAEKSILERKVKEIDVSNKTVEIGVSNKADDTDASKKPVIAVLELLCKEMRAKKLKKHVVAHISDMDSLHQEIAKALKLAKNPTKLALDSIGRFFLLTRKAYYSEEFGHQEIAIRQASVLILECFVMISGDGIEITKEDKEYAENAAIDWRKRMINEGGLKCVEAIDARALLLFISGFGIPDGVFSNEDLRDLIMTSNVKEISNALRYLTILIPKLPEVIDWMVKNNLEIEAVDIAHAFGLDDKCHPETILMTFLHNKVKDTRNGFSLQVNAATMKQLSDLKYVRGILETHKIDPSKVLPGVKINEKIKVEKIMNELDLKSTELKSTLKRKEKEKIKVEKIMNEPDLKSTEVKSTLKRKEKETAFSKELNHQQQEKRICYSHENLPHEHYPYDHYGLHPFNHSSLPSCNSYFDRNLPNNYYVTTYSASSIYSAPLPPPNISSTMPGGLAGSYDSCVYGGLVAEPMPYTYNHWPHWGQPYSRQSQSYDPYPSTAESFSGHTLPGGFSGRRVPSSDLYRFADTVVERGSHRGPRVDGSSTTHSSNLY